MSVLKPIMDKLNPAVTTKKVTSKKKKGGKK